jgi:hypothetical protein
MAHLEPARFGQRSQAEPAGLSGLRLLRGEGWRLCQPTAFSILIFAETSTPHGTLLKKMPPRTAVRGQLAVRNRSTRGPCWT